MSDKKVYGGYLTQKTGEDILAALGGGDTPIKFDLDGVIVPVLEDTVTPANNQPLPVKLTGFTGDITVTAQQLNVALSSADDSVETLQATHDNLNANANLQVNDADNAVGNPAFVSPGTGAEFEVTQDTHDDLNLNANLQVNNLDNAVGNPAFVSPGTGAEFEVTQDTHDDLNLNSNLQVNNLDNAVGNPAFVSPGTGAEFEVTQDTHDDLNLNSNLQVNNLDNAVGNPAFVSPGTGAEFEVTQDTHDDLNLNANLQVNNLDNAVGNPAFVSPGTGAIFNTVPATLNVIDFLDVPLHDASVTTIPKSSTATPITVVASLAAAVKKIQFLDTTGEFIGVYSDPAGTPVLEAIIGPGSDQTIEVALPIATVLGIRNMADTDIIIGNLAMNFMG
jgi:hypothetical protein